MRLLYVLSIALALSACAKKEQGETVAMCQLVADVQQFDFGDGVRRKSDGYSCTDKDGSFCYFMRSVDDPAVNETSCEGQIVTDL